MGGCRQSERVKKAMSKDMSINNMDKKKPEKSAAGVVVMTR